jgi:hypothetical protein
VSSKLCITSCRGTVLVYIGLVYTDHTFSLFFSTIESVEEYLYWLPICFFGNLPTSHRHYFKTKHFHFVATINFSFFHFAVGAIRNTDIWCDKTLNMHLHICSPWLTLPPRPEKTCVCVWEGGNTVLCTVHFSVVKVQKVTLLTNSRMHPRQGYVNRAFKGCQP